MSEEGSYIDDVCNRIKFDKEKLENNELEQIEVDSFNVADFWIQFGASVQSLSNEVTKIGFMCGKKPYPNQTEVNGMMGDVIQYYTIMRDLYLVLPEEVGAVIYKAVTVAVLNIMVALIDIVHSLKDLSENGARERLALTGVFWDACNAVDSLPRNNLQATLQVLDEESALTKDAMEELTNTIAEDQEAMNESGQGDDSETWSNPERELALRAAGLVKVAKACLQRLRKAVNDYGDCSTPQRCFELDNLAAEVRNVSPALDDFVSELYHPVNFPTALENAGKLVGVLRSLLSTVHDSHYESGINQDLVNNLLHFISHNHQKVDPSAANPVPELSQLTFKT